MELSGIKGHAWSCSSLGQLYCYVTREICDQLLLPALGGGGEERRMEACLFPDPVHLCFRQNHPVDTFYKEKGIPKRNKLAKLGLDILKQY